MEDEDKNSLKNKIMKKILQFGIVTLMTPSVSNANPVSEHNQNDLNENKMEMVSFKTKMKEFES